jgi:hypothetical protein
MRPIKLLSAMLSVLFGVAILAVSAFAATLPDISVTLTGGLYPVHVQGSTAATAKTSLETAGGGLLNGSGATLLLLTSELSTLGRFTATFTHIENPEKIKCNTSGAPAGVVILEGEFHLVPTSLSPLNLGILFLVTEVELECPGGINIIVRGNLLGGITGIGSEGTELTGFSVAIMGEKGKQQISEYYNDGGTKIKTKLELEAGSGFTASSLTIAEEIKLQVLGSQMIVITGR